jgi:hypothetical protein
MKQKERTKKREQKKKKEKETDASSSKRICHQKSKHEMAKQDKMFLVPDVQEK